MGLQKEYIGHLVKTRVFYETHCLLRALFSTQFEMLKDEVTQAWFAISLQNLLNDGTGPTSSAFRHVFLGEIKKRKVTGFHSWQRFIEQNANIVVDKALRQKRNLPLGSLRFRWQGVLKPYGSIFFGLPMDFELMFLYTAFRIIRDLGNPITLSLRGTPFSVRAFAHAEKPNVITSAFFEA